MLYLVQPLHEELCLSFFNVFKAAVLWQRRDSLHTLNNKKFLLASAVLDRIRFMLDIIFCSFHKFESCSYCYYS